MVKKAAKASEQAIETKEAPQAETQKRVRFRRTRALIANRSGFAISVKVVALWLLIWLTSTGMRIGYLVEFKFETPLEATAVVARESGLGVPLAAIEDYYYQVLNAPKKGGKPNQQALLKLGYSPKVQVPRLKNPAAINPAWGTAAQPMRLPTLVKSPTTPLPGEGIWQPTKIMVNGLSAVYLAQVRPDAEHTSLYATLAWFNTGLLAAQQIPGLQVPEGTYDHGTGQVDPALKPYYVAGMADGFLLSDSQGGYELNGKVIRRLVKGKATLLSYPDGKLRIIQWGRDKPVPGYLVARQNLDLIVDKKQNMVTDETQSKWGWVWQGTGSGKNLVWRTAMGIRRDGSIVYVQGDELSAHSLADLLVRAGVVEGMALDMNIGFSNAFLYGPYNPGRSINPNNHHSPQLFSSPSDRDFIAWFAKSKP